MLRVTAVEPFNKDISWFYCDCTVVAEMCESFGNLDSRCHGDDVDDVGFVGIDKGL